MILQERIIGLAKLGEELKNLNPDEHSLFYIDRIRKVLIEIKLD